jgi:hypothetical protein
MSKEIPVQRAGVRNVLKGEKLFVFSRPADKKNAADSQVNLCISGKNSTGESGDFINVLLHHTLLQ